MNRVRTAPRVRWAPRSGWAVGLLTTVLAWSVLALVAFVPSVAGAADNGDGDRLTCQLHVVDPQGRSEAGSEHRLVTLHYLPGANPRGCQPYHSSALLVLRAGQLLTGGGALDLRRSGAVWILLVGLLAGLLVGSLPGNLAMRMLTAVGLVLLLGDIALSQFAVSVYSEPAVLVGLLAVVVALLRLWRRPASLRSVLVAATALLALATAKTEVAPLAAAVAALVALTTRRRPRDDDTAGQARWRARLASWAPVVAMTGVLAVAGLSATSEPASFHRQHMYADVFHGLLLHSHEPESDLRELHQPPELARYAGTTYFQPQSALADPSWPAFARSMSFRRVLAFYARHPTRVLPLVADELRAVAGTRDPASNVPVGGGNPAQVCRLCVLSRAGTAVAGRGAAVVPAVWLLTVLSGALLLAARPGAGRWRPLGGVLVVLPVMAAAVVLVAVLGDGEMELVKHGFPAVVLSWLGMLLMPLGLAGAVSAPGLRRSRPRRAAGR